MGEYRLKYKGPKIDELLDNASEVPDIKTAIDEMRTIIGSHNKEVKFFCIEPVIVRVGDIEHNCEANQIATVFVGDEEFEIIPTSAKSIKSLLNYPVPLTWFDWLEGVDVFENIIFDMNTLEMSQKWTQYYQGEYHVQKAQYSNCIFWSDKPYTHSPFEERTNYTLYYTSQLPLCYATNPANTYKPFYFAYGVQNDPNWRNPDYINSFASLASGAPQTFSYYGAKAIGIYNYDVDIIKLCKDARGLMYDSSAIEHAGIFDASNTTNFGAKKGSWQDAFGKCYSLTDLFIKNLKASINVSWSPINTRSIEYIVNNAINTSKITISVSPYTWYRLTDAIKATAKSKNITLELITTNYADDSRWATKQDKITDLDAIREGAAKGAAYEPYVTDFTVEQVRELSLGRGEEITVNTALLEDAIRAGRTIKVPYGGEESGYAIASAIENGDIYLSLEITGQEYLYFHILDSKISADYIWVQPSRPLEMTENGAYLDDNLSIGGDFSTNDIELNGIKVRDENGELFAGEEGQVLMSDGQGRVRWQNFKVQMGYEADSELSETSTNPVQNAVVTQNLKTRPTYEEVDDSIGRALTGGVESRFVTLSSTESTFTLETAKTYYIDKRGTMTFYLPTLVGGQVRLLVAGRYTDPTVSFGNANIKWANGVEPEFKSNKVTDMSFIVVDRGANTLYILGEWKSYECPTPSIEINE